LNVIETQRLVLRRLEPGDSRFILELVNEPSWLKYIGDKGVRNIEDAENYIAKGPVAMYERHGFGLYLVETRASGESIGICGLIKRDTLDDVDLGFAFLPRFWGERYAFEAASGTLTYAVSVGMSRVVAITSQNNHRSIRLLERLGFGFERNLPLGSEELCLYAINVQPRSPPDAQEESEEVTLPGINIALESPQRADVRALILELDAYSDQLSPPESRHRADLSALTQSNVLFAVARSEDGHAIGCAAVVLLSDYGELKRMYVAPSARGQGVGGAILKFLEAGASSRGCKRLMLETGNNHHLAHRTYRANGFRERGPFGAYRPDPLSVFMEKAIAG
jgi:RimJ/RimL family protein N-acetyltransferase